MKVSTNVEFLLDDSSSMNSVQSKVQQIVPKVFKALHDEGIAGKVTFHSFNRSSKCSDFEHAEQGFDYSTNGLTPLTNTMQRILKNIPSNSLLLVLSDGGDDGGIKTAKKISAAVRNTITAKNCQIAFITEGDEALEYARQAGVFNTVNFSKSDMTLLGRLIENSVRNFASVV